MTKRFTVAALATLALFLTPLARGQAASIAVVNPAKVFNEMQETKDLKQKLDKDRVDFETEGKTRQQKVKDLQAQRDLLKKDTAQWADLNKQFIKEAIDLDTWSKLTQAQAQQNQKEQMKNLFDRIVATAGEVAAAKAIDIVIADQKPEIPDNLDQINVDQLRAAINQRNVLYAVPKIDITNDVIASLDAKYKAGGGASSAPAPAPAPAPVPAPAPAPAP